VGETGSRAGIRAQEERSFLTKDSSALMTKVSSILKTKVSSILEKVSRILDEG
jgi:hypothetical protein